MKFWQEHKGSLIDTKNGFNLIDCRVCGFKHIIPIPKKEELGEYYSKQFYTNRKPDYCEKQRESLEWWNLVYSERYERLEKLVNKEKKRILDIGSGPGFFLKFGKDIGWQVLGIEPGEHAVEFSKSLGVEVLNEGVEDIPINDIGKFDAIHMQGVLEHLREPYEIMKICNNLLNPDGLICFTVANEYNPLQEILTDSLDYSNWWFVPPEHINYFDIESLQFFLEKAGFEVQSVISTFPMEMFLLMGENYVEDDDIGKLCQKKRVNFEKALNKSGKKELKENFYKALASVGIGRTVEIIATKK